MPEIIPEAGPVRCCLLGICCDPAARVGELAKLFKLAGSDASEKDCDTIAAYFLERFEVAPLGISAFVIEGYGRAFVDEG